MSTANPNEDIPSLALALPRHTTSETVLGLANGWLALTSLHDTANE